MGGLNAPFFEKLSALYTMFRSVREPQGRDFNKIYSMEIFGTAFDLGYNVLFTPLGAMISNVVSWLVPAALLSEEPSSHRQILSLAMGCLPRHQDS